MGEKKMEKKYTVREQGLDYKTLFEKSPDASLIIEGENIIRCNEAAVQMFECVSKSELIGKMVYDLFPVRQLDGSLSIEKAKELVKHAIENEVSRFEWMSRRKNGELFHTEIVLVLVPMGGKKVVSVSLRDITEKVNARMVLKRNEDIYRDIFEKNHATMLLVDASTEEIVDVNAAACDFYGYSKKKFLSMKVSDLSVDSSREVFDRMEDVKSNQGKHYYLKDRLANGEIRNVETYSGPINKDGKEYLYAIIHDVTEKVKALEALQESEKKFKTLFNNANDLIFLHYTNSNGMPGQFIEVNDAACKKLQYTRDELLQMKPEDITDSKVKHKILEFKKEIRDKGYATFETTIVTKGGNKIPVEVNSHTFKLFNEQVNLSIVRDITDRKKNEVSLIKSKEKYRRLIDFLPESILIIDQEIILFSNAAATRFLGFNSFKEVINKPLLDLIHWEDQDRMVQWIDNIHIKNADKSLCEVRFVKKDGSIAYGEIIETKVIFNQHQSTMIVIRDITEQKKTKQLLAETIEYDKLKTEFFVNISHELRTPLNVIFGALQLFELNFNEDQLPDRQALIKMGKQIKSMKQNCYRLLRLVNNIIDITKIDSGYYELELQNADIINVIENITLSVAEYMEAREINLLFDTEVESKLLACDPDKLERVMLNLLANAIKFTDPGGEIKVNMYEEKEHMIISVQDTGVGIPEGQMDLIFERFRQVDRSLTRKHEGSGIGLSLVKSLIELHGGSIAVRSKLGCGSEFIMKLPIILLPHEREDINHQREFSQYKVEKIKVEFSDIYA